MTSNIRERSILRFVELTYTSVGFSRASRLYQIGPGNAKLDIGRPQAAVLEQCDLHPRPCIASSVVMDACATNDLLEIDFAKTGPV
jgi:hypothetical protein